MPDDDRQRWALSVHGRRHRVEAVGSTTRTVTWYVDDRLVATRRSTDEHVRLKPGDGLDDTESDTEPDTERDRDGDTAPDRGLAADAATAGAADAGAVGVRFTTFGRPRRATLYEADGRMSASARAAVGTGGIDLDPEPGSRAALWEERIRRHPRRHAVVAAVGGVAKVVLPLLVGLLAIRLVASIPWPDWDLPSIPWPDIDLPDVDLPSIPWPDIDLPDVTLPAWVEWVAERAQYVVPVIVGLVLAQAEIRRRRRQDALRAQLAARAGDGPAQPGARDDDPGAAPSTDPPGTEPPGTEPPGTDEPLTDAPPTDAPSTPPPDPDPPRTGGVG